MVVGLLSWNACLVCVFYFNFLTRVLTFNKGLTLLQYHNFHFSPINLAEGLESNSIVDVIGVVP